MLGITVCATAVIVCHISCLGQLLIFFFSFIFFYWCLLAVFAPRAVELKCNVKMQLVRPSWVRLIPDVRWGLSFKFPLAPPSRKTFPHKVIQTNIKLYLTHYFKINWVMFGLTFTEDHGIVHYETHQEPPCNATLPPK